MSYLKPSNAGLYQINALNVNDLYIKGLPFQDFIDNLVAEDQLEQSEIIEIKLLLEYLDTTGLNSAWTVTNSNVNETLRSAITALQTKLANIDTTALTQSSVLNNDNRNSVLKTRLDTAEGDIDGVETKTRFIVEASITGTGDNTVSTYRTRVGPTTEEKGSTLVELNMKNGPANELIGYTIKSNFNNNDYADNESIYSHRDGRLTLLAHTMRLQAAEQIRIGNFAQYGDGASAMAINIGGRGNKINIGRIDSQNSTGDLTEINLGYLGGVGGRNTNTSIDGNVYLAGARFADLTKSTALTLTSLAALYSTGAPSWVLGFFSGTSSLPYSDVWCMKGGFLANKDGDVETSNSIMVKELYVVNKDILAITPKVGFFLAKADYTSTQLIGNHRTQVFEGELVMRNNNITSTNVNWALTGANDACNVVNIGGNDGILIHQAASNVGAPLRIYNTRSGSIDFGLGTGGTQASVGGGASGPDGMSIRSIPLTNTSGNAYTGAMVRVGLYFGGNPQTNPFFGTYQMEVNQYPGREGMIVAKVIIPETGPQTFKNTIINGDSISTQGTITGIDVVGSTSISAPTATATSLVINGNYTGDTTARLYKNADNKLMWNGSEVAAGGVSSGGITYMINVPTNITNPNPTPTETIMTAAYSGNAQRTITQAVTANTAYYIAKYTTEVFDEVTNPVLTGLQQLNQYLVWSSNSHTGQIYGLLWFQATAIGLATLYQRTYASPVTTTAATLINGTPIPTPKGQYFIKFQRVVFPNINVVVSSGPVVLRHRVEGLVSGSWSALYTTATGQSVASSTNNLTVTLDETITLLNSTPGATALRLVLFIASGTGTISQTSAGGADLGAYSLIALGSNTPGLFRTLLHDGTNAKVITPHTTTPTLIEYDLPIDAPYNVSAFPSPTLSTDLYFVQPTGGGNNSITLYFNDGSLSHYHSTITPPQVTPTLAQVLNSGATASQAINMNSNKISGITALEGSANGNWNVKEITAGTGVSVTPTNGNYAIANTGVLSVAAASGTPNISVSTTNGAVTLQNTAPVQDVVASTGISIGYNATTKTSTIYNDAAVQNLTAGTGISISTDPATRTAVITNTNVGATPTAVAGTARDEHQTLMEVGALQRKPDYWGTNWSVAGGSFGRHLDLYVSVDGRLIVSAIHATGIKRNTNYGIGDFTISVTISGAPVITTLCGTSTGSRLFAFGFYVSQTLVQSLAFFSSTDEGLNWTQVTSSTFTGLTQSNRVRCSGDGTYILASDTTQIAGGRFLFSTDGGGTWTRRTLDAALASGNTRGVAMSRSGAVQFILWVNNAETDSRIYRSLDYGATFSQVFGHISGATWSRIETDATGRFVYATRFLNVNTQDSAVYRSVNYGASGSWVLAGMNSIEELWVSGTGQFIGGISVPNTSLSNNRYFVYSVDYGQTIQIHSLGNTTLFRTINGSADGSVLVIGSAEETEGSNPSYTGDGLIRIARQGQQNIQDLIVLGGTLSKANGVYTIATDELWFSGGFEIQTGNPQFKVDFDFLSAGKIDLTQYNIRYEIDCYWSTGTWSYIYPLLSINDVLNTDVPGTNPDIAYGPLSGETNWTNHISNPTFGVSEEFVQAYRNRFFAGYFPASTTNGSAPANINIRQRSLIKGTLSLHRRPAAQVGITDASVNARDILNVFTCDNYATQFYSGMSYLLSSGTQHGTDYGVNHQRINGTGIFTSEPVWTYDAIGGGSQMAVGIFRLGLLLVEGASVSTTRPRAAHYTYRIYRERK